jgi:uncharacterized protein (DUF4415 family)
MSDARTSRNSLTDWDRVDALADEDIDLSDSPEITPEMFARAELRQGRKPVTPREKLTLYVDSDLLSWFKAQGEGYQQRIHAALNAYKKAQQEIG